MYYGDHGEDSQAAEKLLLVPDEGMGPEIVVGKSPMNISLPRLMTLSILACGKREVDVYTNIEYARCKAK